MLLTPAPFCRKKQLNIGLPKILCKQKIFGNKEQPTFKSCKLPLGYLLTISRVATQGVRNKHKQALRYGADTTNLVGCCIATLTPSTL